MPRSGRNSRRRPRHGRANRRNSHRSARLTNQHRPADTHMSNSSPFRRRSLAARSEPAVSTTTRAHINNNNNHDNHNNSRRRPHHTPNDDAGTTPPPSRRRRSLTPLRNGALVQDARAMFHIRRELSDLLAHVTAVEAATRTLLATVGVVREAEAAAAVLRGGVLAVQDLLAGRSGTMDWEPCGVREFVDGSGCWGAGMGAEGVMEVLEVRGVADGREISEVRRVPEMLHVRDDRRESSVEGDELDRDI